MIEAFNLGPFLIPTRSLILIVSVIFAIWVSQRLSRKFGLERHPVKRITENSAWFGLAGARLGFVALNWSAYSAAPWTALYFWQPGYHFISGILVGSAYAIWQISRKPDRLRPTFFKVLLGAYLAAGLLFFSAPLSLELLKNPGVPGTGDFATDFTLQNFSAETVKLSDLAGRGVVLNFWATWCPPCRREMPLLDEMQKVYADRGLSIIGVDIDEPPGRVKAYIDSIGVSYPIWVDAPPGIPGFDRSSEIFKRFGGVGLPTTLFIDRSGKIKRVYVGELSRGFLQNEAEQLLEE